jgi:hypothetical protein
MLIASVAVACRSWQPPDGNKMDELDSAVKQHLVVGAADPHR